MEKEYNDKEGYEFREHLIELNRSLVECIIMEEQLSDAFHGKDIYEILGIPEEFYNEIIEIMKKYEKCTLKKITKKVLFECSYRYYGA